MWAMFERRGRLVVCVGNHQNHKQRWQNTINNAGPQRVISTIYEKWCEKHRQSSKRQNSSNLLYEKRMVFELFFSSIVFQLYCCI